MKEKIQKLSRTIVHYSLKIKENDRVLITAETDQSKELVKQLIVDIVERGGIPFVKIIEPEINALLLEYTKENRIEVIRKNKEFEVENYDAFVQIRYSINEYDEKKVSSEVRKKVGDATKKIDEIRINERRWVLLNFPSILDAYKAQMTTSDFCDYAFDVMTVDYETMCHDLQPLKQLMEKTDQVRLVAPDTDITFSIKGMPIIPCCGEMNIPDGEIYTAPLKTSVNGRITYNTPCPYQGNIYHHVSLNFKDGKIVEATCDEDTEALNKIFDMDEGARYVGEFSLGLNPKIKHPMGDILFDEKIIGSIHFTPGRAYKDADNGNISSIHWDMVLVQRSEYGGGEIYFDGVLIRKDGLFVLPELKHLNGD